jgi:peptide-methionine (S)-S-oxide reductase
MKRQIYTTCVLVLTFFLCIFYLVQVARAKDGQENEKASVGRNHHIVATKTGEYQKMETAIFGAGCFWGVEETFRHLPGVVSTSVGYSGGRLKDPTYEDVCSGTTGHTEAVKVEYDPSKIKYPQLLKVFFENHDPTTPNRQGPDLGYQYRSVIFYTSPEQKTEAEALKEEYAKSKKFSRPIVTAIEPASAFYDAEEYHQRYLEKHGMKICH